MADTITTYLDKGMWSNKIGEEKLAGEFKRRVHAEKVAASVASKESLLHEVLDSKGELVESRDYRKHTADKSSFWVDAGELILTVISVPFRLFH